MSYFIYDLISTLLDPKTGWSWINFDLRWCIQLIQPVYMIKTQVAFLEGRLLFSQSELSERFSKSSDWL